MPNMCKLEFSEGNNIGDDVVVIRNLLNMTQEQLSKCLHISRVTLSKIERCKDYDISYQDLFMVFYLCPEILDNNHFPDYIKERAEELKRKIKVIL